MTGDFISKWSYMDQEYSGIICNSDPLVVSAYVFELIKHDLILETIMDKAKIWWDSMTIFKPLDIQLGQDGVVFQPYLRMFSAKEFKLVSGPLPSIMETYHRRGEKKRISVRNVPTANPR